MGQSPFSRPPHSISKTMRENGDSPEQTRVSGFDAVRIAFSAIFLGLGSYFIVGFLLSLRLPQHRPYTQLILGALVTAYGAWRLLAGRRNYQRMRQMDSGETKEGDRKS